MKTYKIFVSPLGQTEAVKQGWSWPGFFFPAIWPLVKKLWGVAIAFYGSSFFVGVLLSTAGAAARDSVFLVFGISIQIFLGARGNQLREKNLSARGYEHEETVEAPTPAALAIWLSERDKSES